MGVYGGPNIADEGLVFFYDTGNDKSYKGEPTVNLVTDPNTRNFDGGTKGNWTYQTVAGSGSISTENPKSGTYSAKLTRSGGGGEVNYYWNAGPGLSLTPGSTYTFSMDVWCDKPNMARLFSYLAGTNGSSAYHPGDSKWHRLSMQFAPAASTAAAQIRFGLQSNGNYPATAYFDDAQIELKSHATPFVDGTRSATQGLLDLVQATSFDLTDTSYTSAAELTFDGTDDEMTIAYSDAVNTNFFTVECVARLATADNTHKTVICRNSDVYGSYTNGWHIGTLRNGLGDFNNDWRVMFYGDSGYADLSDVAGAADGNYHHIVAGCDGTNVFLYVDGVLAGSTTKPAGNLYTSNIDIHIARNRTGNDHWDGDIPLIKFYNKALTSTEILNNFNGIKSRFGI